MNTFEIVIKVIPILVAIALGYFLTRAGFLKESMVDAFKKIVVNVTLPAGLFLAFIKIQFKVEYLIIIACVFVTCFLLFLIAKLIARVFSIKSKYFPFLLTGFEAGMMGYALFTAVFGADAAADFAVVDIGQVVFVFLVFVPMIINMGSSEKGLASIKTSLKTAMKSPVIWAIILGLAGSLAGLWAYEGSKVFAAFDNIFSFASAPTALLICLVIGSGLKLSIKSMKMEILTALLKVAFALLFAFILVQTVLVPLGVDARIITALYALCCLPAPFVIPVFMKDPSTEDLNYVSNTLSIGSIIGVICFTAVVLLGL
ncbi:MAG: hypothetical protein HN948_01145 [Clostridia bacterium]|jgi:malate permease and related proteins|nr:hypothetical protein [Clostridia bacterium]MBT7121596.1 hypothetical protein [Clostridia bacterium]